MRVITDYTLRELIELFRQDGLPVYRARQVFAWVYERGIDSFERMTDIPRALREDLAGRWRFAQLHEIKRLSSGDGTEKFLLGLSDGAAIEAVSIPSRGRMTGCLSTQVGCKYACVFCASGSGGFVRDLTAAEIVQQALFLHRRHRLTHIVFMGMGEPFDNYECFMKAVRIINDPHGLHIGARRITVSTSGVIPGIQRLSREGLQVELSVSLHAADSRLRSRLMPINKKYPLEGLLEACRDYYKTTNRQITFEYVLIEGINTGPESVHKLAGVLKGMDAKVNLIPYNPVASYAGARAQRDTLKRFKDGLSKEGIVATERVSRGSDIKAACGQLRMGSTGYDMPGEGVEPSRV